MSSPENRPWTDYPHEIQWSGAISKAIFRDIKSFRQQIVAASSLPPETRERVLHHLRTLRDRHHICLAMGWKFWIYPEEPKYEEVSESQDMVST